MPLFEDRSSVFIVRIWCETGGELIGAVRAWRGSIEHVPSGHRAFFQELDAVLAFMKPHLLALGIEEPNRFWEHLGDIAASPANHPSPGSALEAARPSGSSKHLHGRRRR